MLIVRSLLPLAPALIFGLLSCSEKKKPAQEDDEPRESAGAAVIRGDEPPSCSSAGWERVDLTVTANEAGTLEVEVVDRWDPEKDVDKLQHHLSIVGREALAAGASTQVKWAFGSMMPSMEPAPGLCPTLARDHASLVDAWAGPQTCTYETATMGKSGSSSNLLSPSCGERGWRAYGVRRKTPINLSRDRWTWIAGWVWAPPDSKAEAFRTATSWGYQIGDERFDPTTGRYPAWTLRAKLSRREIPQPQRVEPPPP